MDMYAESGVEHAWIVDPEARTVEVYRNCDGLWLRVATAAAADEARLAPFPELELHLGDWWVPASEAI